MIENKNSRVHMRKPKEITIMGNYMKLSMENGLIVDYFAVHVCSFNILSFTNGMIVNRI